VPLVGASAKDSNRGVLGSVRTYARLSWPSPLAGEGGQDAQRRDRVRGETSADTEASSAFPDRSAHPSPGSLREPPSPARGEGEDKAAWLGAVRAGRTFVTAGPLLALARDGDRVRASARARGGPAPVEIVANGRLVASGEGSAEAVVPGPGWVAARGPAQGGFAHTSPVALGEPAREPEAVAALRALVHQTREWIETRGRFANPKRKQALLDRCDEAVRKLEDRA
jgi:hypothetical protein